MGERDKVDGKAVIYCKTCLTPYFASVNDLGESIFVGMFEDIEHDDVDGYLSAFKAKEGSIIVSQKPFSGWNIGDILPVECKIN